MLGLLVAQVASAKSGGVDYSWGAGALAKAHDYTVTMMLYVLYVCYAVGSVMAIISALLIYFKMQYHEGDVVKNILTLLGAVLFIIGASIISQPGFSVFMKKVQALNICRLSSSPGSMKEHQLFPDKDNYRCRG